MKLEGSEETSPAFLEIEKSVLIMERKTLIVFIFGLNLPLKM